jgi:dienelactone hydrolase
MMSRMSFLWYWPAGGWDVDRWKKAHPWEPIRSEQSDHKELLPIDPNITRDQWEAQRTRWKGVSDRIVGTLTDKPPATMRHEFLTDRLERGGRAEHPIVMRRLRFTLTDSEWGYAWLLVPMDGRTTPRPAVIALHQTSIQGKNEPVGLEGQPGFPSGMDYGLKLARQGFAVLAPDAIAFGERAAEHSNTFYRSADQFFTAHPEGSVMGKMAFDVSRAIDLLQTMPEIDPQCIGCAGHSHGGYGTLFAMVGDERLKAGFISCGLTMLRSDPTPQRWWRKTALIPRLGFYEGSIEQTPIDYHLWLALIAPRPIYVSAGLRDAIFPKTDNLPAVMKMVKPIWDLYGAGEMFRHRIYDGPHDFPRESQEGAFNLLRDALM